MKAHAPHCDESVLHAPGECVYCDAYPDWQAARSRMKINFTGHNEPDLDPCPSTLRRSLADVHHWPGNRPRTKEFLTQMEQALDQLKHDLEITEDDLPPEP